MKEQWFLWAIFYSSLAVYIVHRWMKDSIFVYLLGLGLTFIVPDVIYNLEYYKFMYPFFVAGYYCAQYGQIWVNNVTNRLCTYTKMGIMLAIWLVLLYFWDYNAYIYTSGYTLLGKSNPLQQFGIDLFRMVTGFAGGILAISIIEWIKQVKGLNYVLLGGR